MNIIQSEKRILLTGGLGFIGFNALQLWKKTCPNWKIVVVDNECYAAQFKLKEKKDWCKANGIDVECIDISDPIDGSPLPNPKQINLIEELVKFHNVDTVVNFAAESHVDNSISGPEVFFKSNVIGTTKLLEVARKLNLRFHQISTDEVYGITHEDDKFDEAKHDIMRPSSPYSSSKASADLIVLSYVKTFGLNATVSRCSNNFGPWQHPEKMIPTICRCLKAGKKIPVYGDGMQCRQWIHVDYHNAAIAQILEEGKAGKVYNISTDKVGYIPNLSLVKFFCTFAGKGLSMNDAYEHVKDRPGHDTSYFIYNSIVPKFDYGTLEEQLRSTYDWYMKNLED